MAPVLSGTPERLRTCTAGLPVTLCAGTCSRCHSFLEVQLWYILSLVLVDVWLWGESAAQGKFRRYREPGKWFSASWAAGSLQGLENAVLRQLHRLFKTLWNEGNRHSKVTYC